MLGAELVALAVLYFVVPTDPQGLGWPALLAVAGAAFVMAVVLRQTGRYRSGADADVRVDSLVLALVLSALVFALAYDGIHEADPSQFEGLGTRVDALYFSVVTIATVGYGDVHATGQLARALVTGQIAFDLVVLAAAASTLSRVVAERRRRPPEAA